MEVTRTTAAAWNRIFTSVRTPAQTILETFRSLLEITGFRNQVVARELYASLTKAEEAADLASERYVAGTIRRRTKSLSDALSELRMLWQRFEQDLVSNFRKDCKDEIEAWSAEAGIESIQDAAAESAIEQFIEDVVEEEMPNLKTTRRSSRTQLAPCSLQWDKTQRQLDAEWRCLKMSKKYVRPRPKTNLVKSARRSDCERSRKNLEGQGDWKVPPQARRSLRRKP